MAKSSKNDEEFDIESSASDEDLKTGVNSEDEEELEAVARTASPNDEVGEGDDSQSSEEDRVVADVDEDEADDLSAGTQIGRREKARLREMQKMKKQKIKEILDAQNAAIDVDMNSKGKGRLKYLLQQTEIFSHFAQGSRAASEKKPKGSATSGYRKPPGSINTDAIQTSSQGTIYDSEGGWETIQPSSQGTISDSEEAANLKLLASKCESQDVDNNKSAINGDQRPSGIDPMLQGEVPETEALDSGIPENEAPYSQIPENRAPIIPDKHAAEVPDMRSIQDTSEVAMRGRKRKTPTRGSLQLSLMRLAVETQNTKLVLQRPYQVVQKSGRKRKAPSKKYTLESQRASSSGPEQPATRARRQQSARRKPTAPKPARQKQPPCDFNEYYKEYYKVKKAEKLRYSKRLKRKHLADPAGESKKSTPESHRASRSGPEQPATRARRQQSARRKLPAPRLARQKRPARNFTDPTCESKKSTPESQLASSSGPKQPPTRARRQQSARRKPPAPRPARQKQPGLDFNEYFKEYYKVKKAKNLRYSKRLKRKHLADSTGEEQENI